MIAAMCGRYVITSTMEAIRRLFEVPESLNLQPRYNVAPTQQVPVVRRLDDGRHLAQLRWGLIPSWAKDASMGARMINARAETVAEKPAFRSAFRQRRCLVVSDGFYEWRKLPDGAKQPYFITLEAGGPFAFAGLWETWRSPDGERVESCTIVTTGANEKLVELHDRMPVIVAPEDYDLWLAGGDRDALEALLRPCPAALMTFFPVNRKVNNARFDDPSCLERVAV
jgi:putative SOS response-associated peptidase YedK